MDHLVLTVFAPDKPGQVERIAQCIAEHGGNWLESRMSRMAGQFAGILRVGVPAVEFGPVGAGHHGPDEWVSVSSLGNYRRALVEFVESLQRPLRAVGGEVA